MMEQAFEAQTDLERLREKAILAPHAGDPDLELITQYQKESMTVHTLHESTTFNPNNILPGFGFDDLTPAGLVALGVIFLIAAAIAGIMGS